MYIGLTLSLTAAPASEIRANASLRETVQLQRSEPDLSPEHPTLHGAISPTLICPGVVNTDSAHETESPFADILTRRLQPTRDQDGGISLGLKFVRRGTATVSKHHARDALTVR